jgi:hypothetical protein
MPRRSSQVVSRPATVDWFVVSTPALLVTPCCEVARGVQVSDHDHFAWAQPVEKARLEDEKFAQIRLIQFGNDATALGVLIE